MGTVLIVLWTCVKPNLAYAQHYCIQRVISVEYSGPAFITVASKGGSQPNQNNPEILLLDKKYTLNRDYININCQQPKQVPVEMVKKCCNFHAKLNNINCTKLLCRPSRHELNWPCPVKHSLPEFGNFLVIFHDTFFDYWNVTFHMYIN